MTTPPNNNLWPTRLYYLFWFAGLGFISPFLNLFFVHIGLRGTEIGLITAISSVVTLVAAPVWANRNDRWRNPRIVLQLLLVFAGLTNLLLSQQTLFLAIALVVTLNAFIIGGIAPLSDGLALRVTEGVAAGYGSIRVYGSLGWMIFVLLAGWIVERTELKSSLIGGGLLIIVSAACLFPIHMRNFTSARHQDASSIRNVVCSLLKKRSMIGAALMIIII